MSILTSKRQPAVILRRMNEAGVLGRFIPEFGKIVAMMQFNMYHHYTVDEHLIRTVDVLVEDRQGRRKREHPLASKLLPGHRGSSEASTWPSSCTTSPRGGPRTIPIAGAKVARKLCPRLGLNAHQTELVVWLIRNISHVDGRPVPRPVNDRKTIERFRRDVSRRSSG
jgi:[protein-PII] uridylyltransferase